MTNSEVSIFWFRRDLRLEDNTGLDQALMSGSPVLPIFIFDDEILNELPADDARVTFIWESLKGIHAELLKLGSSLKVYKGRPVEVWKKVCLTLGVFNVRPTPKSFIFLTCKS